MPDAPFALLAPLGILLFLFRLHWGIFAPSSGLYLQSLNFSAWDIGLLMSQMQLMRLFGPYLWGWLADHFGRRLLIVRLAGAAGLAGFYRLFLAA